MPSLRRPSFYNNMSNISIVAKSENGNTSSIAVDVTPIDQIFASVTYTVKDGDKVLTGTIERVHMMRVSAWRFVAWAVAQQVNKQHGSDPFSPLSTFLKGQP